MKIRALVSFSGAISMGKGQETECSGEAILQDLLQAGYIEEVQEEKKQTAKKGVKSSESK